MFAQFGGFCWVGWGGGVFSWGENIEITPSSNNQLKYLLTLYQRKNDKSLED